MALPAAAALFARAAQLAGKVAIPAAKKVAQKSVKTMKSNFKKLQDKVDKEKLLKKLEDKVVAMEKKNKARSQKRTFTAKKEARQKVNDIYNRGRR